MKKIFAMLLVAVFAFAGTAIAAEKVGVYVTPKITLGITHFKMSGSGTDYTADAFSYSESYGSRNKSTFGGGVALGYDFSRNMGLNVRTELEYMIFGDVKSSHSLYYDADNHGSVTAKLGVQSLFLNVYYDFRNESAFVPYVGGGLGFGMLSMKADGRGMFGGAALNASMSRKTQTNFAWNLGLGCAYEFNDTFALDLSYRYAQFGTAKTSTWSDATSERHLKAKNVGMHQFTLGARITF